METILEVRAQEKALRQVDASTKHMALEAQSLSQKQMAFEVKRLASDMLKNQPSDFWNDEA